MQDFPFVLSEYDEINSLLYKPINSTQRIKYTCFNTSASYIVVGSTSGSIYLFSKEPCSFLQLIPLSGEGLQVSIVSDLDIQGRKNETFNLTLHCFIYCIKKLLEGAVSQVLISPDEKTVALATARGSICLVALKPTPKLIAVSTEQITEQINCLCWNENGSEIYIGDGGGNVYVMVLSIFTVNGMFQAPACMLMHLDSAIVQLSFSSSLLLVSTLTRCYICDTIQEQYKQVGNKARNGEFGACFYKTYTLENESMALTEKEEKLVDRVRAFSFIPEGDSNLEDESSLKIICARPGSRLWEVSANGVVLKTHQFKEALAISPTVVCKPNRLKNLGNGTEESWSPQSINFARLFIIGEKYLFSYTSNGLYIMNPSSATVVLWCNELSNIISAETVGNKIYLMTAEGEFHCLTLSPLDTLILRLYHRKRYSDCLDVCLLYKSQLYKSVNSIDIDKLRDIESKPAILQDAELIATLHPIILSLQSNLNTCPIKLNSGIVVVNTGSLDWKDQEYLRYKSTSRSNTPLQSTEATNESFKQNDVQTNSEAINNTLEDEDKILSDKVNCNIEEFRTDAIKERSNSTDGALDPIQNVMQRIQSDLQAVYHLTDDIKVCKSEEHLGTIIARIQEKLKTINDSYEDQIDFKGFLYEVSRTAELYYFSTLLDSTSPEAIDLTRNCGIVRQIMKAFVDINAQNCPRCTCGAPCPVEQLSEPKFLPIGKSLLRKIVENEEECTRICESVPYMWREYLPICIQKKRMLSDTLLRQCLQIKDNVVLSVLLPALETKRCSTVIACMAQMQKGMCLFCGTVVHIRMHQKSIDWSGIVREVTKKQGPDAAITFLRKVEKLIPNLPLDGSIFQSLIFSKILHHNGMKRVVDFNKTTLDSCEYSTMCSAKIRDELVGALEKDLGRPIHKSIFGSGAHHWGMRYESKSSMCPCCTLSLQTPVLLGNNGIAIFSCGHAYHVNCMIEKKLTNCILHS